MLGNIILIVISIYTSPYKYHSYYHIIISIYIIIITYLTCICKLIHASDNVYIIIDGNVQVIYEPIQVQFIMYYLLIDALYLYCFNLDHGLQTDPSCKLRTPCIRCYKYCHDNYYFHKILYYVCI